MNKKKWLLPAVLLAAAPAGCWAQKNLRVTLANGGAVTVPLDSIESIEFGQKQATSLQQLVGQWLLVASPNGVIGESGLPVATIDTISFTATLPPEGSADYGQCLYCHTTNLHDRTGHPYPAHWRMVVEEDEQAGKRRVGWVLSQTEPASDEEFWQPAENYLEQGHWYWGVSSHRPQGDTGHRYIYLLSENIDTHQLEGMTLWSPWVDEHQTTYRFPQNYEVYGVVSLDTPYSYPDYSDVGYIEIWASPRFIKQ